MPAAVLFAGMTEFRKELRTLEDPRAWSKELATVHREVGREVAGWAQAEARGMGGTQAHFANAIRGYGSAQAARIGLSSAGKGQRYAGAQGAYYGSKQFAQFPDWVGVGWQVGGPGGPRPLNDPAISGHIDDVLDTYGKGVDRLTRRAFPDR